MMFGAVICTPLSDKFGRKPVFLFSNWAMVVVGVANAFIPNYYVFVLFRFLTGLLRQVRLCRFTETFQADSEKQPHDLTYAVDKILSTIC